MDAPAAISLAQEWLYNRRSELAGAQVGTNRYGYAYDTIGNRTWAAANAVTNNYAVNALNQYVSVLHASPLLGHRFATRLRLGGYEPPCEILPLYDADGNMTSDSVFSYAYDAENRLVSATPLAPVDGSLSVVNGYDHKHRRVLRTVKRVNGETWIVPKTHTFVWDGDNIVLESITETDGTRRTIEYFWGSDLSGMEQGAGGVGGLLAVSLDGVFHLPCYDHNGNIVCYVSETGVTVAQYVYDPYGNLVESDGTLADRFSFGFSTKYRDRETGLVAYQRRFYSPGLGRWINRDPIEEEGGENLYGFCGNSPCWRLDPFGLRLLILKHWKGINPPGGWGDHGRNRGQTHYKEPSISYKPINKGQGKIGFEVTITPPVSRVDVYFHEKSDLQVSTYDENEHIQWIVKYDEAIETFKREAELIEACPQRAYQELSAAIDRLNRKKKWIVAENNKLDAPGGPHGH